MMGETSRRSFICGALAAGLPAAPVAAAVLDGLSQDERAFLALAPTLAPLLLQFREAKAEMDRLYQDGEDAAGPYPGHADIERHTAWRKRSDSRRDANGYHEAWQRSNGLWDRIWPQVEPFEDVPAQSMEAIMLKALIAIGDDLYAETVVADLQRVAEARLCA